MFYFEAGHVHDAKIVRKNPGWRITTTRNSNNNIRRETILFFGAKNLGDLYYFDELKGIEGKLNNFKFYPTLSRVGENDKWDGERGRVTSLIEKYIPQNAAFDVYLCGAPPMIESCMKLLAQKGIPEDHIYFDKFE